MLPSTLNISNDLIESKMTIPQAYMLATNMYQENKLVEAQALLNAILKVIPRHPEALHLAGVIYHQSGQTELGISLIKKAIEIKPDDALFHTNIGEMYRTINKIEEAINHGEKAVSLNDAMATAHSNLGIAYYDQDNFEKAEACQIRALEINPQLLPALNNLGSISRAKKDKKLAITYYEQVIAIDSEYIESISNLGSTLTEDDQPENAIKVLLPLIHRFPNHFDLHCNIATAFLALEEFDKAEFGFEQALIIKPHSFEATVGMARVLQEKRKLSEALVMAKRAQELGPKKAETYNLLGGILKESDCGNDALIAYEHALKLDPLNLSAYLGRGHLRMEKGDLINAESDFNTAINLDKNNLGGRLALTQIKKVSFGSDNMEELISQDSQLSKLPSSKRIPLHFALGKCYEDTKYYDLAFQHYQSGCNEMRQRIKYNADDNELVINNIKNFFTKDRIDSIRNEGCTSELPIFVLGMPRSGTTLTETIIASHPLVYGAGELSDMLKIADKPSKDIQSGYPLNMNSISKSDLKKMGETYVSQLQKLSAGSLRITDKMPSNFNYIGLIHLMLPNAKIIHVKRNPIDTCLSCYTRLFNKSQYQSYNLEEIGRYYRNYESLMQHWKSVLPNNAFYEIQYENIVADQKGQAKSLLEFCELEWDEACIDFHKTERNIRTASVAQVRQPIYMTSVEKWRHYEKYLGPLFNALGDLAVK